MHGLFIFPCWFSKGIGFTAGHIFSFPQAAKQQVFKWKLRGFVQSGLESGVCLSTGSDLLVSPCSTFFCHGPEGDIKHIFLVFVRLRPSCARARAELRGLQGGCKQLGEKKRPMLEKNGIGINPRGKMGQQIRSLRAHMNLAYVRYSADQLSVFRSF